jgi:hypothetical protein
VVPAASRSDAGIVALSWVALTYWVGRDVVTLELFTHCTTEQGRMLAPVTAKVSAALPASAVAGASKVMGCGASRFAEGDVTVKGSAFDVPAELDTETIAAAFEAVSTGKIAAVSWVELIRLVARGDPFQFTTESLVNVVPGVTFTVRVKPLGLPQNGAEAGERDAIAGGVPATAPIVKRTMLDTSVVFVL